MRFPEKLARLTEDANKAKLCRRAGLPPNAIADYIKEVYTPRAESALKLARALHVSLDWLLDDSKGWPPVRLEAVCSAA